MKISWYKLAKLQKREEFETSYNNFGFKKFIRKVFFSINCLYPYQQYLNSDWYYHSYSMGVNVPNKKGGFKVHYLADLLIRNPYEYRRNVK